MSAFEPFYARQHVVLNAY